MFRIVSLAVVLTLIVVLGITFFKVVAPFLLPLFVAGMTAILAQPLFRHFIDRTSGRVRLAAGLTTTAIVALILLPIVVATAIASMQLYAFAVDVSGANQWDTIFGARRGAPPTAGEIAASVASGTSATASPDSPSHNDPAPEAGSTDKEDPEQATPETEESPIDSARARENALSLAAPVVNYLNEFLPAANQLDVEKVESVVRQRMRDTLIELGDKSLGLVTGVLLTVLAGVVALFIYTVALYYFFADGPALLTATENLVPLHVEYQRQVLGQFATVVRSVVSATFLAALAQAIAITAALALCGFKHLMTLFVLSLLSAMIPIAGTWLIWGPCVVILALGDHWVAAVFLTLWGAGVVGVLDNVIRTYLLNVDTKLHPLLALISVLGGLQVMGLWGVFIGPVVASCLHALVKIFNLELAELSRSRFGEKALVVTHAAAQAGLDAVEEVSDLPTVDREASAGSKSPASLSHPPQPGSTELVAAPGKTRPSKRERKRRGG